MGTDMIKSYDSLQQELEKARSNLRGLNDNIRRIIGRDPQDTHLRGDRKRSFSDSRRNDFNSGGGDRDRQRNNNRESSPTPPVKRRTQETKSVFSRLSGPPPRDDDLKPKIHSRVIRELPTRQEIVAAQGTDEQSKARNRRMFGCLLGTLQKFCQEESRLKQKEDMKAQIEKKLEEQEIQERENMKKERQTLFVDRKRQQMEIKMLELKMNRLREFEICENSKNGLQNFIKTKTKPHIYFRPKILNEKTEKRLADCRADLQKEMDKKRSDVNDEVAIIEQKFRNREQRIADKLIQESISKHDRRNDMDEEDDRDSIYGNSDVENVDIDEPVIKSEIKDSKNDVSTREENSSNDHDKSKSRKSESRETRVKSE